MLIDAWAASINLISCTNFFFFYSSQAREKVVKRLLVVALAIHDLFEDEVSYWISASRFPLHTVERRHDLRYPLSIPAPDAETPAKGFSPIPLCTSFPFPNLYSTSAFLIACLLNVIGILCTVSEVKRINKHAVLTKQDLSRVNYWSCIVNSQEIYASNGYN